MTGDPVRDGGAWPPVRVLVVMLMFVAWVALLALLGVPARVIVVFAVAAAIVNLVAVPLRRRFRRRGRVGALTGRTLAAPVPPPAATPAMPASAAASSTPASSQTSWVGGASLATARGRMNATAPFAVLTLTPGSLELSLRPKLLNQLWRISPLALRPSDNVEAFPVRTRGWTRGVGIRGEGSEVSYFWTDERDAVIQALASAGYRVSGEERRYVR
jgi:hypothetical protein